MLNYNEGKRMRTEMSPKERKRADRKNLVERLQALCPDFQDKGHSLRQLRDLLTTAQVAETTRRRLQTV
jgi:hypothetical protein